MPTWRDLSALSTSGVQSPWTSAPRNLAERTDLVMSMLEAGSAPMLRVGPAPQPIGQPTWVGMNAGYGGDSLPISVMADPNPRPMASPAMALQVGRVGLAALQALGVAGAAALTAILNSYRSRLGRLPTPAELDSALQQQVSQPEISKVPSHAQPNDLGGRRKPNREEECERLHDRETAICNQVSETLGKKAGAICHQSAMTRYSECLRNGVDGVTTKLTIVTY